MTEPFLDLRDVGLVLEGVGRGGRPQGVHTNDDTELLRIAADELVDPISGERPAELAGAVVADRTEEGAGFVERMAGGLEVIGEQLLGARLQRDEA